MTTTHEFTGHYFPHGCRPFVRYFTYPVVPPTVIEDGTLISFFPPVGTLPRRLWPHTWLYFTWLRYGIPIRVFLRRSTVSREPFPLPPSQTKL